MRRMIGTPMFVIILLLMVSSAMSGRFNSIGDWLMNMVLMFPGIVIGLSFHEFGHAYAAVKCGDPTPRNQGRLTINPIAHVDPIGLACLFFVGFGWGVPVQINPRNFRHPRRDELLVSLAGVIMNFILAVIFTGILRLLYMSPGFLSSSIGGIIWEVMLYVIQINLVLLVFNLLPVPPLDGFGIITQLFNLRNTRFYYTVYNNGFFILVILILFGVTDRVLGPIISFLYSFITGIFF